MTASEPTVFLVDDDDAVRDALELLLDSVGLRTAAYPSAAAFLEHYDQSRPGCLVLDIRMPAMNGMELQAALVEKSVTIPIIFLSGHGNVPMSAKAFRTGAVDFLEKPFDENVLLQRIQEAIRVDQSSRVAAARRVEANTRLASLTPREREVMLLIVAGHSNKDIATKLGLSTRTIETHRGHIMEKTGAHSLADLIELALVNGSHELK
jgi:two-component system, LuxR family, response regulator FixJ